MILAVGVKVLLKNKKGKYLIVKRAPSKYKGINSTWDILGGRIRPGSLLIDNLEREVMEESGLRLTSLPRLIGAQDILWYERNTHVVRLTYIAETDGEPVLNAQEHVAYRWLDIKAIKNKRKLDVYLKEILNTVADV